MERLKVTSDEKLTELGRKFQTFIALSAKKRFYEWYCHSVV